MTSSDLSNDADRYAAFGAAAKAIGTNNFYRQLLKVFGAEAKHDYAFAVRYCRENATDVLHTMGHPEFIVEQYRTEFHEVDPFGDYWRKTHRKGLVRSAEVISDSAEARLYTGVFLKRAKIKDEIGIVLPSSGGACIALFLENGATSFPEGLGASIEKIFPAIEGLHNAHIARTYCKLVGLANDPIGVGVRPLAIIDRHGRPVFRNASWREAEAAEKGLAHLRDQLQTSRGTDICVSSQMRLRSVPLSDDFVVAPGGRLYTLDWSQIDESNTLDAAEKLATVPLTKLERDILALISLSKSSGQIAMELQLAKGTVKNYKQRLYRKFAVTSERELLGKLAGVNH